MTDEWDWENTASDGTESTDEAEVYTVSEVTQTVQSLLDSHPELSDVRVEGEITNFNHHSSGHMYFSLKDDDTRLKCVMFRRSNSRLGFEPEDGDNVVAEGRISVYEARGEYQLYVESMEKVGDGELYRRFLELKKELREEGLFEDGVKKPLPSFPQTVGVVTSDSGAALHDIRDVISRRFPATIKLAPAKVQGDGAAPDIADSLRFIDGEHECDVSIVGRGGGSMEDLWA
ncbi:MAG: exodeoxyribonuclease VII large subunit, partial [Halobacteria archaeon]|nr:exodeoxyribonuclease VII large subunit [Halobacteria archaeon]